MICGNCGVIFGAMKINSIQIVLLCFALASVNSASAQDARTAITPVSHIELFNGKDFTGWTFCMKDNADPLKPGV